MLFFTRRGWRQKTQRDRVPFQIFLCFIQNPLGVKVIGGHFPCMRYNGIHFLCQLTCLVFQLSVLLE